MVYAGEQPVAQIHDPVQRSYGSPGLTFGLVVKLDNRANLKF